MRSAIALALAVALGSACGGAPASSGGGTGAGSVTDDGLRLTWKAPAPGTHETVDDRFETSFTMNMSDRQILATQQRTRLYHVDVVEAGDLVTKLEVHYETAIESGAMGGQVEEQVSPLQGNKYVVWSDGGAMQASRADGAAVTPDELDELIRDFDDQVGRVPAMPQVIGSQAWKPGVPLTLTPEHLRVLSRPDMTVESGTITLAASDAATATFEISMVSRRKDGMVVDEVPMQLTATCDVATMRLLDLVMTGTMSGEAGGMPMTGDLKGRKTSTFR